MTPFCIGLLEWMNLFASVMTYISAAEMDVRPDKPVLLIR